MHAINNDYNDENAWWCQQNDIEYNLWYFIEIYRFWLLIFFRKFLHYVKKMVWLSYEEKKKHFSWSINWVDVIVHHLSVSFWWRKRYYSKSEKQIQNHLHFSKTNLFWLFASFFQTNGTKCKYNWLFRIL